MQLPLSRSQALSLRRRLLAFYDRAHRNLPWRQSGDAYAVLVSEIMLQQTTVAAVIPFYKRFMNLFPDVSALAAASEEQVLAAWSGLGYYRRARFLHKASRQIRDDYGGRLPGTVAELRTLPGIGPYTAGAVASIAFGLCEPVLDGNVVRVLSRLSARSGRGQRELRVLESAAARLVDGPRPGDLNQALMELGATVCTPRQPACTECPVSRSCRGRRQGAAEAYPEPRQRPPAQRRRGVALVIRDEAGQVVLVQREAGDLMPGLWELPGLSGQEKEAIEPAPALVTETAARQLGQAVALGSVLGRFSHTVVDRRVRVEIREARLLAPPDGAAASRAICYLAPDVQELPPLTAAARKALNLAGVIVPRPTG